MTADHAVVKEVLTSRDFVTGLPEPTRGPLRKLLVWSTPDVMHPVRPPSLLVTEPPDHTRYRKLVTRVFTVRAVEQLRGRTAADRAPTCSTGSTRRDPVDLVAAYCSLLPVTVIARDPRRPGARPRRRCCALGRPRPRRASTSGCPGASSAPSRRRCVSSTRGSPTTSTSLRRNPGDDLLSQLVAAQEDGVGLTDAELQATAGLVLAAGFETTVNLLGNGIALLARQPRPAEAAAASEPELWPNAVDEVLRVDPPVLLTGRHGRQRHRGRGRPDAGAAPWWSPCSPAPTATRRSSPSRSASTSPGANARDHLSFSAGRHYCLGAALARMEGEVGLRTLFERYPDLRRRARRRRRSTRILRGFSRLPVRLEPASISQEAGVRRTVLG